MQKPILCEQLLNLSTHIATQNMNLKDELTNYAL